ncbi:MAG: hypothetical protein WAN65_08675 [Candidatus Sulfotelmatobacter sp.]
MRRPIIALLFALAAFGSTPSCTTADSPHGTTVQSAQPAQIIAQPKSAWTVESQDVNPIDGVTTQLVQTRSASGSFDERLALRFENGKLLTNPHRVGLGIFTDEMVAPVGGEFGEYETHVRIRFDDEQPLSQVWAISDDHKALFPHHREAQFLAQILKHKKLALEFAYYEHVPHVATFDLTGLADDMKAAALQR